MLAQERVLQRRDHQLTLEGGPLVLTVQSSPESGASAPLVASTTGQVPTTTPLDLSSTTVIAEILHRQSNSHQLLLF